MDRWDRIVRTLKTRLVRQGTWMVSGAGVRAGVAFGANLVLVRLLLPEHFGRFAIVQANISLVAALTNLKIGDLLLREPSKQLDDRRLGLYMGALGVQTLVIGLGALGLLWSFGLLRWDAGILLLSVLASSWVNAEVRLFERRFDYRNISLIETGAHGAGHFFTVAGALAGLGALVLYLRLGVQLLGKLTGLKVVGGLRPFPLRWLTLEEWKTIFQKIKGFWLDGVLAQSFERLVILLVGALVGERATGFFYQARRLAMTPHQLASPITSRIAFNYFSHQVEPHRRQQVLRRTLSWELAALLGFGGLAFLLADPIIPWLFGENWQPVVPLFRAMAGVVVGMTMFNTLNAYFMALDRLRPFILLGRGGQYIGLLVGVASVALLPTFGFDLGLALGLSGAYLIGTISSWHFAATEKRPLSG